jgi:hypothetical protein
MGSDAAPICPCSTDVRPPLTVPMTSPRRPATTMRRLVHVAATLLLAGALPASALRAQQEETPVTFDAAQRMTAITPMLAERLKLQAPAWPVTGGFREARLYAVGDARVLVVQRQDGTLVRYALDAAAAQSLQQAVEEGMRLSGNPAGEPNAYVYSEVAGTRFARKQLLWGTLLHGPLLASFADNGETGMALYFTGAAMPSLMALGFARDGVLTRSQTDLGMDATLRWAALGSFGYRALTGQNRAHDSHAAAVLGSSILGTAAGLAVGRGLTDGEAAGMIAGSNYMLAITTGFMGMAGAFEDTCEQMSGISSQWNYATGQWEDRTITWDDCRSHTSQAEWGTLLAAGVVGYPLGLAYTRRKAYTVTAGDANALLVPAAIGTLAALTAIGDDTDDKTAFGIATGGLVLGLVAGDRLLVKPFDYTRSQATGLRVGAIGGGLLGLAAAAGADDGRTAAASAAVGMALGTAFAHTMLRPRRASSREVLREARLPDGRDGDRLASRAAAPRVQWQLDPAGLAMAAARAPGRHGILSLTF